MLLEGSLLTNVTSEEGVTLSNGQTSSRLTGRAVPISSYRLARLVANTCFDWQLSSFGEHNG
jgi:hypothetical protein